MGLSKKPTGEGWLERKGGGGVDWGRVPAGGLGGPAGKFQIKFFSEKKCY